MKAIILAGGFGTRLRSVVADVPKPMADIAGQPFLEILLKHLAQQGVTEFILSVHYLAEKIISYFSQAQFTKYNIKFVEEPKPLGTGGAISYIIKEQNLRADEAILVLNGDSFVDFSYQKLLREQQQNDTALTIVLREVANSARYSKILVDEKYITSFAELGDENPALINAGVYLLKPQIFNQYQLPETFSFERDFMEKHIKELKPSYFVAEDYFIDIGIAEDYARAQKELLDYV